MGYNNIKTNSGNRLLAIVVGVLLSLLIQLIGAVIVAAMIENGAAGEGSSKLIAYGLRGFGLLCGIVVTWLLSGNKNSLNAALTATASFIMQTIAGMLFWQLDYICLVISASIGIGVYFVCYLVLSYNSGRGEWGKLKKLYS